MEMTFDEYDEYLDKIENMKTKPCWPTLDQIDLFEKNPEKWLLYCCYILEKSDSPKNNEEKYARRNLSDFVNRHLELVDSEETV